MEVLVRDYDLEVNQFKGYEKIKDRQLADINRCRKTKYISVIDESDYTINKDGNPEMKKKPQEEYDDFVANIREEMNKDAIEIIDEGYGSGEDEIEWHITGVIMSQEIDGAIAGIIEIETCVRTKETEG